MAGSSMAEGGPVPGGGLRSTKKRRTREALLAEAERQLRAGGLDAVRVGDLAARVGVSQASFFNYFGSREAFLSEWAHRSLAAAFAEGADARGAGSLRGRLRPALRAYAEELAREAHASPRASWVRDVWRVARLQVRRDAPGAAAAPYTALERALCDAQTAGELRDDVSAPALASALQASAAAAVLRALEDGADGRSLAAELLCAVDLVLDGARKRNERVRPSSRG